MPSPSPTSVRLLVALAAVLLPLAGCSSSKEASSDDDRLTRQLEAIDEAVDLSDEQANRVRAILVAEEAERPSGPPPRGQAGGGDPRGAREARRAETDRLIEAVLTDEQIERYRAWRASQPERPEGRPPRRQ